jgi:hypothetical protein
MKICKQTVLCLAIVIVVLVAASAPVYADIVDGGFESGTLSITLAGTAAWQPGASQVIPGWTAGVVPNGIGASSTVETVTDGTAEEAVTYARLLSQNCDGYTTTANASLVSDYIWAHAGDTITFDYRTALSLYGSGPWNTYGVEYALNLFDINNMSSSIEINLEPSPDWSEISIVLPDDNPYQLQFIDGVGGLYGFSVTMDIDNVLLLSTPEPSTLVLLVVGAIGFFGFAWRQRKLAK